MLDAVPMLAALAVLAWWHPIRQLRQGREAATEENGIEGETAEVEMARPQRHSQRSTGFAIPMPL